MNPTDEQAKLWELIKDIRYGMLTHRHGDGQLHMVAFFPPSSNFVILGFEDIYGGGDLDYNDLVLALDVGANNAAVWRNPQGSLPK